MVWLPVTVCLPAYPACSRDTPGCNEPSTNPMGEVSNAWGKKKNNSAVTQTRYLQQAPQWKNGVRELREERRESEDVLFCKRIVGHKPKANISWNFWKYFHFPVFEKNLFGKCSLNFTLKIVSKKMFNGWCFFFSFPLPFPSLLLKRGPGRRGREKEKGRGGIQEGKPKSEDKKWKIWKPEFFIF